MHAQTAVQIAWVTQHLDTTEDALSGLLGARKWIRLSDVHFGPDSCKYRGRPADFGADIALSYAGDVQLELIAPVTGESIYTEFLERGGPGLPDAQAFDAALKDAELQGAPVLQQGVMPGGMPFAYVSVADAGVPSSRSPTSRPRSGRSSSM
jgi:hypothetical protein